MPTQIQNLQLETIVKRPDECRAGTCDIQVVVHHRHTFCGAQPHSVLLHHRALLRPLLLNYQRHELSATNPDCLQNACRSGQTSHAQHHVVQPAQAHMMHSLGTCMHNETSDLTIPLGAVLEHLLHACRASEARLSTCCMHRQLAPSEVISGRRPWFIIGARSLVRGLMRRRKVADVYATRGVLATTVRSR